MFALNQQTKLKTPLPPWFMMTRSLTLDPLSHTVRGSPERAATAGLHLVRGPSWFPAQEHAAPGHGDRAYRAPLPSFLRGVHFSAALSCGTVQGFSIEEGYKALLGIGGGNGDHQGGDHGKQGNELFHGPPTTP